MHKDFRLVHYPNVMSGRPSVTVNSTLAFVSVGAHNDFADAVWGIPLFRWGVRKVQRKISSTLFLYLVVKKRNDSDELNSEEASDE